ncbi:MAG: hydrogen peroxide-dependent heme synthase [Bryobacteraceae bacterium]|nr:hydrogen peroxide-dependent heme synthase [Bryobacteraceae bacterium]
MSQSLPPVPLTLEGATVLHQMMQINFSAFRALPEAGKASVVEQAAHLFDGKRSAPFAMLGHKGDLMLIHFRRTFEELAQAQLDVSRLLLSEFLTPVTSYLSVIELGLYESTQKAYLALADQGITPHSEAWDKGIEEVLNRQREAMAPRLFPDIPASRYVCFYPMDRRRGETKNWYQEPMAARAAMMHDHGMIGRRYAGAVRQIISGSIGFDDWEWGVDLFAEDPLVFKKLIYEMRFDEVSAVYAAFGKFYVGLRFDAADLGMFLSGTLPGWSPRPS